MICSPVEGRGRDLCSNNINLGMPLCHVCKRHPEASALLLAMEGETEAGTKILAGIWKSQMGEAGKVESKEKRDLHQSRIRAQEQRKGR